MICWDSMHRMSPRQKERSRMTILKRAHLYHCNRMYLNAMYRERSPLDDKLIQDLVQLSLFQYTRLRRYCQSVVRSVSEVSSFLVSVLGGFPHPP
jgi:proteasome activator subunit 4